MISRYKLKIILWYVGLLTGILVTVFVLLYTMLGYQLRQEIDQTLMGKVKRTNSILRDTGKAPPCYRRRFLDYITRRHYDFYDIREHTDVIDDKYILFVYCRNRLMYLSKKYRKLNLPVQQFQIRRNTTDTITLNDIPFTIAKISKTGYSVYLGYELSTIRALQSKILQIFLIIFPFAILLAVLCGYYVTHRSLKIIKTISSTAERISSKNLSERIRLPGGKDEITDLIITLNSMIDRLEKSFNRIQQFSHDAAHEIRTPLTIIRGEIEELLKEDRCPDSFCDTLESILEEVQYLSSISDKLLLIHGMDTGKIGYRFQTVDLSRLMVEIYEDAQVLALKKQLKIEIDKKDHVKVHGNEELIVRLLWNVIENAIKYTPQGGIIRLRLEKNETMAVIMVEDTGIGIPAEDLPRIFDRFYRVDKSRSRELGGTGLGLAICKWIVEQHHGDIRVTSEPGKGSGFIITLPLEK